VDPEPRSSKRSSARHPRDADEAPPVEELDPETREFDPFLVNRLSRPVKRAPRRVPKAPKPRRPSVRRAVCIIVGAAVLAFAGRFVAFAVEPVLATWRTGREIQRLQSELDRDRAVNKQLEQDIAYLQTPAGIEQEARRRGYVLPGEVALSVVAPDPKEAAAGQAGKGAQSSAPPQPTILEKIGSAIESCLAVFGKKR
jgi:cell division protein FtsB